eukprot:jgi/Tetstr1/426989/TSEL_017196.t1
MGDRMDWPDDFQFGATVFSIGLWRSRGHFSLSIMVNKRDKKFIVLVDKTKPSTANKKSVRLGGHLVGIDYRNPLCEDGRLVLECRRVIKREFSSLNDVHMFYMPTPPQSPSSSGCASHVVTAVAPAPAPGLKQSLATRMAAVALQPADAGASIGTRSRLANSRSGNPGEDSKQLAAGSCPLAETDEVAVMVAAHDEMPQEGRCRTSQDLDQRPQSSGRTRGGSGQGTHTRSASAPCLHGLLQGSMQESALGSDLPGCGRSQPEHDPNGLPGASLRGAAQKAAALAPLQIPSPTTESPPKLVADRLTQSAGRLGHGEAGSRSLVCRTARQGSVRRWGEWDVDTSGRFRLYATEENPWRHTGSWPHPARWTLVSEAYYNRTVVLHFSNPLFPLALESVFGSDERLLHLYESGLPSWAVFMPTYGIWYRPWMRTVTFYLFIAISLFSLACGFYDLYKNVPFLNTMLKNVVGNMYLPFIHWLEEHTKVRLSILLTYLFGKSPLLMAVVRLLTRLATFLRVLFAPLAIVVARPFMSIWRLFDTVADSIWAALCAIGTSTLGILQAPLGWITGAVLGLWSMFQGVLGALLITITQLGKVLEPLGTSLAELITQPLVLLSQGARFSATLLRASFSTLQQLGGVLGGTVQRWLPLLRRSASLAAEASRSAAPVANSAASAARTGGYWKKLILKVAYALRSVVNVITYFCCAVDRHRKSMVLAMGQRWEILKAKTRERLAPATLTMLGYACFLQRPAAAEASAAEAQEAEAEEAAARDITATVAKHARLPVP